MYQLIYFYLSDKKITTCVYILYQLFFCEPSLNCERRASPSLVQINLVHYIQNRHPRLLLGSAAGFSALVQSITGSRCFALPACINPFFGIALNTRLGVLSECREDFGNNFWSLVSLVSSLWSLVSSLSSLAVVFLEIIIMFKNGL